MPSPGLLNYLRCLLIPLLILGGMFTDATAVRAQPNTSAKKDSVRVSAGSNKKGELDKPINYSAKDSIIFNIRKNKVYLFRNAELHYGDIHLTAHYIEVDLTKKEIYATGGFDSMNRYTFLPVLKDGDESYTADSMRYNSQSKKGRVYGLRLKQDEAYIHLNKVLKQEDGSFVGQNGKITTCSDDHPHFYFNASKLKVVPNDKVFFGAANLVVEDIPTPLAVPFGIAPIKKGRRNGILFPGYGYNQANKTFYLQNLGYYRGLGPYADITLTTDAYLNGDMRLGMNTNFVKRYKFRSALGLNASWFGNGEEQTSPDYNRNLDFSVRGNFGFDSKFIPGTVLNGDVNIQTGNYNRLNSRNITNLAQNQFNSGINYQRNFLKNKLNLSAAARHSQNTADHSFRLELPSLSMGVPSITPFSNTAAPKVLKQLRLSYNMNFNNVLNTYDTILFSERGRDEFKKMQNGISHSLPVNTNFKMFKGILNVSPSFNYNETWYFRSTRQYLLNDTGKVQYRDTAGFHRLSSWSTSAGVSTNIYGTFTDLKSGKLRAIRHTITPTISFGYNPEISPEKNGWMRSYKDTSRTDSIVKYNIFEKGIYGSPSRGESGSIGFSVNNNLQAKKVVSLDSNGKEKLDKVNLIDALNIGGSYNFLADSFHWSDIRAGLNTSLMKIVNINMDANFSPYAVDENRRRINAYAWKYSRDPLHFKTFRTSINTRLSPETFKKKTQPEDAKFTGEEDDEEMEGIKSHPEEYYNFHIPWNLSLNYIIEYNNDIKEKKDRFSTNRIAINGEINITPEWKVGYNTGYDLLRKEVTPSQFTVSRNLHCWQIDFSWIPSGYGKQWVFTLRPKSTLLQDLKLNKRTLSNPAFF